MSHPTPQTSQPPESKPKWIKTTIQIPEELYRKAKKYMEKHGYKTFSEFIRDLLRERVEAEER